MKSNWERTENIKRKKYANACVHAHMDVCAPPTPTTGKPAAKRSSRSSQGCTQLEPQCCPRNSEALHKRTESYTFTNTFRHPEASITCQLQDLYLSETFSERSNKAHFILISDNTM